VSPAAAALLAAALAGPLVARRRPAGWAWLAVGLAATALLAPALAIPDGVPSPAAIAGAHPPWQGRLDPAAGNPALSDVVWQIQPWLLFARHELRAGRLPTWNPFQDAGAPFWGNGQSAPLFPLHLLFAALPEGLAWLFLPWLKVTIGGMGVWWWGRRLGLSPPAAVLAALAFPLAGMPVSFLLYPLGSAVALAPWVLGAVERVAAGRWGLPPLAALTGLQLLAGHPETCLHTAMLSALYLLVRGAAPEVRAARAWARLLGGWLAGAGLAAVHLVPFVVTLLDSSRWQAEAEGGLPAARVLLTFPLRLAFPDLYGNPAEGTWWGPYVSNSTAVYAGAATLALAVAGLGAARWGRRRPEDSGAGRRWAAVAAVLAFSLAAAYQLPGLRHLLESLPLVDRALHHRLLFAVDLALALLAGAGLDRWRRGGGGRGLVSGAALLAVLAAAAWIGFAGDWSARGLVVGQAARTGWLAAAALGLALAPLLPSRLRPRVAWLLPALVAADLLAAHAGLNPGLSRRDLFPPTPAVRFLQAREGRVIATGAALRPNAATVYRLEDIRGDDTVRPARTAAHAARSLGAGHPTYFVPVTRWDPGILDELAVRWLLTGPGAPSPLPATRLAYDGPDARVWERPGSTPRARLLAAPAGCAAGEREWRPAERRIDWRCAEPATLVVSETYDRGWTARHGGADLALEPHDDRFLAVRLPAGEGTVELVYRPVG
ncbi:MAG TPA: hypothetical protein VHM02_12875, partial [Thermoanaerobaculia bacterium]|nr:hypothetical protein [Thermoanaerobaculia bacterium]